MLVVVLEQEDYVLRERSRGKERWRGGVFTWGP